MRLYFAVSGLYALSRGFIASSFPLFLSLRGLDQFHIHSLPAIFLFVWLIGSVPAGAFADAIGRRRSFLIGAPMRLLGYLLYFFSHWYALFVLAELIDGTGSALCASALDAWDVDALDAAGFEGLKDNLFSRLTQLTSVCLLGAALVGGLRSRGRHLLAVAAQLGGICHYRHHRSVRHARRNSFAGSRQTA